MIGSAVDGLLAASAHQAKHVARIGIDDYHSGLGLEAIIGTGEVLLIVLVELLQGILHEGIHNGVDLKSAGIDHHTGGVFVIAVFFHKGGLHVAEYGLLIPGENVGAVAVLFLVVQIQHQLLRLGSIALGLRKVAILHHLIQNQVAAEDIVLGIADRVIRVWGIDNSHQ